MWKCNIVDVENCEEALETILVCEHMLRKMKDKIQEHIDFNNSDDEYYEKYGRCEPPNAEIVRISAIVRDELLDVKKMFEGAK